MNDKCIEELYNEAKNIFRNQDTQLIRDSRGIVIRTELNNLDTDFYNLSTETYQKALRIEYFLAKIQKPAIIEVHVGNFEQKNGINLKKWEVSTVVANKIEAVILNQSGKVKPTMINSVGYGEFLPAKNTSNNGGKYLNRLDIIVLCNISGE